MLKYVHLWRSLILIFLVFTLEVELGSIPQRATVAKAAEAITTTGCSLGRPAFVHASDYTDSSGLGLSMWVANGDGTFDPKELSFAGFSRDEVGTEVFGYDSLSMSYFGDVNQDGMLDIVHVTENNNNSIYVYLNNGNNTFATVPIITTGMQAGTDGYIFAGVGSGEEGWLGDTNRDGKLDYIFSGSDNNVHVYLGNGDGTFARNRITTALTGAKVYGTNGISALEAFFVEDVNRDGSVDVVGAFYEGGTSRIHVWLGNGNGTFNPTLYFNALLQDSGSSDSSGYGNEEYSQLADVNGDGALDYLYAEEYDSTPQIWAFLNNGNGTFLTTARVTNVTTVPLGYAGRFANITADEQSFFADVTNDGRVDYITSYENLSTKNGIGVYIGNGDGSFATTPILTTIANFGTGSSSLEMSYVGCGVVAKVEICSNGIDDDHDGLVDANDPECGKYVPSLMPPICNGTFAFVSGSDYDTGSGLGLSMWAANGNGTFSSSEISFAGFDRDNVNSEVFGEDSLSATYFADVNQDRMLDIVHVTEYNNNSIYVYLNKGNNTFATTPIVTSGMQRVTDGYIFAGISSGEEGWLGDTNWDGKLDYIFSGNDNNVHVYLGDGDGTFAKNRITTTLKGAKIYGTSGVSASESFFAADVNGDDSVDLVGAFYESSTSRMQVWLGNGDGTFNPTLYFNALLQDSGSSDSSGYGNEEYSALADVNGDGMLDYLYAEAYDATAQIWAFLNNGDGTFQTSALVSTITNYPNASTIRFANFVDYEQSFFVDVNDDGIVDYISTFDNAGLSSGIAVYPGNGDGTFSNNQIMTPLPNFATGVNSFSTSYLGCGMAGKTSDLDHDDSPDIFDTDIDGDGLPNHVEMCTAFGTLNYDFYNAAPVTGVLSSIPAMRVVRQGTVADFNAGALQALIMPNDNSTYSLRYSGILRIPYESDFTFYLESEGGSAFWMDNALIVNNDGIHGLQEHTGTIHLLAGYHTMQILYFKKLSGEGLKLSMSTPTLAKQPIPFNLLIGCDPQADSDSDGVANYSDLDSDNDTIPDAVEVSNRSK